MSLSQSSGVTSLEFVMSPSSYVLYPPHILRDIVRVALSPYVGWRKPDPGD